MTRLAGARVTLRAYHDDEVPILVSTWADAEWFAPKGTGLESSPSGSANA